LPEMTGIYASFPFSNVELGRLRPQSIDHILRKILIFDEIPLFPLQESHSRLYGGRAFFFCFFFFFFFSVTSFFFFFFLFFFFCCGCFVPSWLVCFFFFSFSFVIPPNHPPPPLKRFLHPLPLPKDVAAISLLFLSTLSNEHDDLTTPNVRSCLSPLHR